MTQNVEIPIACELSSSDQQARTTDLQRGVFRDVVGIQQRDDGYSLRFEWSPDRIRKLAEVMAKESDCCAFLDYRVEVPRGKQSVWLHLTGPEASLPILEQEVNKLVQGPHGAGIQRGSVNQAPGEAGPPKSTRWLAWTGAGLGGAGVLSLVCCVAPMLGLAGLGAGAVGLGAVLDSVAAVGLASGSALLYVAWSRRKKSRTCADC